MQCRLQDHDTAPPGLPRDKEATRPQCFKEWCLLMGLGGRDTSHSQEDKDLSSVGGFQPWHCPLSSPPQAVLSCPKPAPVSLQAVDTQPASPPCSHTGISRSLLMCFCPHWLFFEMQSQGLITDSLWVTCCTAEPPFK